MLGNKNPSKRSYKKNSNIENNDTDKNNTFIKPTFPTQKQQIIDEIKNEVWIKSSYFDGYGMQGIEVSNLGRCGFNV